MVTVGSRLDWLEVVPNRADAHGAAEDGRAVTLFSSGRSNAWRGFGNTAGSRIGSWRTCHSGRRTGRQAGTETPRDGSDQRGEGRAGRPLGNPGRLQWKVFWTASSTRAIPRGV